MSRLWSKSVRLHVGPHAVCGRLEPSWLGALWSTVAGGGTNELPVQRADTTELRSDPSNETLARAVDAVLQQIASIESLQRGQLHVGLADALVHRDVVAGDFAGDSDRQLQAVAIACVSELLGDAVDLREVRWQLQADGKHLLIGAIDRDQLGVLSDAATRHGLSMGSVQPDFCLQWNRHAGALRRGAAVFAVADGHDAVVACVADGAVAALSRGAGGLDKLVDRLLASIGLEAADAAAFVLVNKTSSDTLVSPRWTVLNPEAGPQ